MTFLSPWNLAWLGLLMPLVLLYVLKRRRENLQVPSTLLWSQALRDMQADRPFRRLLPHMSLVLQVLAVCAGALALSRPTFGGEVLSSAWLCVVVDTSASMATRDAGEEDTRMERAQEALYALSSSLGPGAQMVLIEAGEVPVVQALPSHDARALERAIDGVGVSSAGCDLSGALDLASERLRDAPGASRLVIISDAAMDGELNVTADVEVEFIKLGGEEVRNLAIVDADVRASSDRDERDEVFVRLLSTSTVEEVAFVTVSDPSTGRDLSSRRVTVPAEGTESIQLTIERPTDADGLSAPVLHIKLGGATGAWTDALSLDDEVFVSTPGSRRLPVILVGSAPAPLRRVLRSDAAIELFQADLDTLEAAALEAPGALHVYSGAVPSAPPPGDSWVIDPEGERVFEFELGEEVEAPRIVTWRDEDPRLRFLDLGDVLLGRSRSVVGGDVLISAQHGDVASTLSRPTGETTLLAFDPSDGTWPREASFVIFFRNLLERARDRRAAGGIPPGSLGQPLQIPARVDGDVRVESSRAQASVTPRGGVAIVDVAARPGLFRVNDELGQRIAVRNLVDAKESDARARMTLTVRGGEEATATSARDSHEITKWLALLVVLLVSAELVWSSRRSKRRRRGNGASI
ncbi:MAG: BatA and WFA domain-containing protein [Polyangiales bacterium]